MAKNSNDAEAAMACRKAFVTMLPSLLAKIDAKPTRQRKPRPNYLKDWRKKKKEREEIVAVNLRAGTWKHEVRE